MNKKNKGFTLAELLIVVAIIAVLVAVSIPIFTSQLKKARLAVDHSAIRDAYALIQVANNTESVEIDGVTYTYSELKEKYPSSNVTFVLGKDCNSLIDVTNSGTVTPPENAYRLEENGCDDSNTYLCPNCAEIATNQSVSHYKDSPIYAYYSHTDNLIYLGMDY